MIMVYVILALFSFFRPWYSGHLTVAFRSKERKYGMCYNSSLCMTSHSFSQRVVLHA